MSLLQKLSGELDYDISGLNSIVYHSTILGSVPDECDGGSCYGGCSGSCYQCKTGNK